jgi:hypothetical protein
MTDDDNIGRYEILVDGVPRIFRDNRNTALAVANYLRRNNPNVIVKDRSTGEIVLPARPE